MDYAQDLQEIIDRLKADTTVDPKWRNKVCARLEEIQPWCMMLYETPDFTKPAQIYNGFVTEEEYRSKIASRNPIIPPELAQFADQGKIRQEHIDVNPKSHTYQDDPLDG